MNHKWEPKKIANQPKVGEKPKSGVVPKRYFVSGTIIKRIPLETLSPKVRSMILEGKGWITRNSRCPCNSGKRFKNCCMKER